MHRTLARRLAATLPRPHENPLGLPRFRTPPATGLPHKGDVPRMARGLPTKQRIPHVSKVLLVSSAKGGVGKSTVSANVALSLSRHYGLRVGLLDADIFGPSVPTLFDLAGEPRLDAAGRLVPLRNYGVKTMSMGYLVPKENAVVWRGLMVMKAMQQLLLDVNWGEDGVDVLVVDMPPGTGDTQLSVTQLVEVDGAVVVSTPQDIALVDAVRGVNMWRKVQVPIVGMVQNMAHFTCPHCKETTDIFGSDGVRRKCDEMDVPFLGNIPLDAEICADADRGKPTVVAREGALTEAYKGIAGKVYEALFKKPYKAEEHEG